MRLGRLNLREAAQFMPDPTTLLIVAGTFLLAGTVKGVVGLGLPPVSLALLAVALDLPTAMALLILPALVTNVWQALTGGHGAALIARLWPFLLGATLTVWVGVAILTRVDALLLTALLGVMLTLYAAANLGGFRVVVTPAHERRVGVVLGPLSGILTGMTGASIIPGVMFLQALGLSRDALVQAMGILFTVSVLALAGAMQQADLLTLEHGLLSAAAVPPTMAGVVAGRTIRRTLSERRFQTLFFVALLLLGVYTVATALRRFF